MLQIEIERVKKNLHNTQAHYSATTGGPIITKARWISETRAVECKEKCDDASEPIVVGDTQATEWKGVMLMKLFSGQSEHSSPLAPTETDAGIGQDCSREGRR